MLKAFISHKFSHPETAHLVTKVADLLRALGCEPFISKNLESGVFLPPKIAAEIKQSDLLIFVESHVPATPWMLAELDCARGLEKPIIRMSGLDISDRYEFTIATSKDDYSLALELAGTISAIKARAGQLAHLCANNQLSADRREMIDALSMADIIDPKAARSNLSYKVTLSRHEDPGYAEHYYKNTIDLEFSAWVYDNTFTIRSRVSRDPLMDDFWEMMRADSDCLYRYILTSSLSPASMMQHFRIRSAMIKLDGESARYSRPCEIGEPKLVGEDLVYDLTIGGAEIGPDDKARATFVFVFDTIVEKYQNKYPMILGYPVKGVHAELDYEDTDITDVEALTAFTGPHKMRVTNGKTKKVSARGTDWLFPDSAVVFTWTHRERVAAAR